MIKANSCIASFSKKTLRRNPAIHHLDVHSVRRMPVFLLGFSELLRAPVEVFERVGRL